MDGKTQEKDHKQKYDQFGKQIATVLKEFERTRQWADIGNWLIRLHPILASKKFGNVPHKIRLSKRLAQCLSPGIPSTIHSNALKIYSIILNNFGNKVQLLPLLSIGLFPFFEYCSTDLKFELLTIFENYFIKTPECLQMVTSLVNTLLTSFVENNEALSKRVFALCDLIAEKYGRVWVDGAVWVNVLKSPKVRNAGYRYFMKSFKDRDKAIQEAHQAKRKPTDQTQTKQNKIQQQKTEEVEQQIEANQKVKIRSTRSLAKSQQLKIEVNKQDPKKQNVKVEKDQIKVDQDAEKKKPRKKSQHPLSSQDQSQEDVKEVPSEIEKKISQKLGIQTAESLTSDMFLDEASAEARQKLLAKYKNDEDSFRTRFPNFPTLVMNAICQSLQSSTSDNLIRRNTLDLILFYLGLDHREEIEKKDAIRLTFTMLHTLNLKQYSLTRRIYTYLFGPPNVDGVFEIDPTKKAYQLQILKAAMSKILTVEPGREYSPEDYEGGLNVVSILLEDNEQLAPILLPSIAYKILKCTRTGKVRQQYLAQFEADIIQPHYGIFLNSIRQKMQMESVQKRPPDAREVVLTLSYFYKPKDRVKQGAQQGVAIEEAHEIIQWLLDYLLKTKCGYERLSIQIIDFCIQLVSQLPAGKQMNEQSIKAIDQLIKLKPSNSIYAKLLDLHPRPAKQDLLPFITEPNLAISCIQGLLKSNIPELSEEEKRDLLMAIFRLFRGRIWQYRAIELEKQYKQKLPAQFAQYINQVPPEEWLIYWSKMNGNVDGGVIRMLKSLQSEDKLNRQQLKKWIQDSKAMSTKLVDPVYELLAKTPNQEIEPIYKMLKRVFKGQRTQFSRLLYNKREKYLVPLIDKIFDCIDSRDQKLKIISVDMLQFILENTASLDQKLIFFSITFRKTIEKLKQIQKTPDQEQRQIEIVQYFISMTDVFESFKGNFERISVLQQIIEGEGLLGAMTQGMKTTNVLYLRTLYIQFLEKAVSTFINIEASPQFISKIVKEATAKICEMLRQNNGSALEQILVEDYVNQNRVDLDGNSLGEEHRKVTEAQINMEAKYAQVIQLWSCIGHMYRLCTVNKVDKVPLLDLLAFIVQSFPLPALKYEQISNRFLRQGYMNLQAHLDYTSGLKKEVLGIFNNIWKEYPTKILDFLVQKGDPRLLLHSQVKATTVIDQLKKSSHIETIKQYYENEQFKLPKGIAHYNYKILTLENQLCYFLYLFLAYTNLSTISAGKHFYQNIVSILRCINLSHHAQTKLWVLEILHGLTEKTTLKSISQENIKIKEEMQNLLRDLLQELTPIIAKERLLTTRNQIKVGFFHKLNKEQVQQAGDKFDFLRPFPPTISKQQYLFQNSMQNLGQENLEHIENQPKVFIFSKPSIDLGEAQYKAYLSVVVIKTYMSILYKLLNKVYENDHHKIAIICRDNIAEMLPTYDIGDEYSPIFKETFAKLNRQLFSQADIKAELIKGLRKNIIELFMRDDFFKCTATTLYYWQPVIDACTQNHDLISELISKEGLFEGLFSRKNKTTEIQIRNFERVCFLIFCGRVDKYEKKLRVVLESLSKVMKAQNPSPALLILILFCIRVLLMRLSQNALNRMFRSIWPSLIALLIQIFTKSKYEQSHNLRLAGLRMIELVHALGLEEFNIHKWIFIFDYFGIKIEPQSEQQQKLTQPEQINLLTPFKFKPILSKILPKSPLKCNYIHQQNGQAEQQEKRNIIIVKPVVESAEELQNLAQRLLQYMMDLNQSRAYTLRSEIENLIENDFITLDDYIYDVK